LNGIFQFAECPLRACQCVKLRSGENPRLDFPVLETQSVVGASADCLLRDS
jgi:hypothetical protein